MNTLHIDEFHQVGELVVIPSRSQDLKPVVELRQENSDSDH
jgi:hypothetical protein